MTGPDRSVPPVPPVPRKLRYGVYTLAFLVLAFVMVVVSSTQKHYTVLTFTGLIVGLVGAAWCTARGLRNLRGFHL